MTTARVSSTGRRLGLLLLSYLGAGVAVIAFTPFHIALPTRDRLIFAPGSSDLISDILLNLVMFVPLGFLVEHTGRGRIRVMQVLALGAAASVLIEATQLFLPGRWTTATDLLANTAGAAIGAIASVTIRRRLGREGSLTNRLFLDLPLLGICWLLLPMLWVRALQGPLGSFLPLMAAGGFAMAGAGRSNAARERHPTGILWPLVIGWSIVATLPGLVWSPIWMLSGIATAIVACLVGDMVWRDGGGSDRRVEPRAVAAVLVTLLPWFAIMGLHDVFNLSLAMHFRGRILESLALACGFTVFGYALAEWKGRSSTVWPQSALLPMLLAALIAWPIVRGRVVLIGVAALIAGFGALLFDLHRDHVIALRLNQVEVKPPTDAEGPLS